MQRTLLLVSLIALAAAPAAAQGKSKEHRRDDHASQFRSNESRDYDRNYRSKTQRTFIDSRGLECREKSEIKKDGRRKYDLKCKEPKQRRGDRRVSQACVYGDTRCDVLPRTGGSAPRSISDILGEIANQRRQTPLTRDPRG
jgi:hypothetical protein